MIETIEQLTHCVNIYRAMKWSDFIYKLRKSVGYIKLHGGKFNVCTRDVREGLHRLPGVYVLHILIRSSDMHNCNELSANGFY